MSIRLLPYFLSYLWRELSLLASSLHQPPDPDDTETPSTAKPTTSPNAEEQQQQQQQQQHSPSPLHPTPNDDLCPPCRALTLPSLTSAAGAPHHATRAQLRRSASSCALCAALAHPTVGVTADDGTLVPLGQFNGVFRVAAGVLAELRGMEAGRLRAVEVFEGAGRGLVGRVEEGEEEGEGGARFAYLGLGVGGEMGEGADEISRRYDIPVRRPLANTSSASSFETARRWLATCDAEHDCCPTLPTAASRTRSPASRLLDLQAFPEPCLDVRLVETRREQDTSKYTALSHRWGTTSTPFTTTHATLPDRTTRIPFAALPRTFQHAVHATRALGLRYLWIDSLCILQDSADDWAGESGRMGAIYAKSYVTLAADRSGSSDGGLFNEASVMQDEEPLGKHVRLDVRGDEEGRTCRLYVSDELVVPSHLDSRGVFVDDEDEDPDRMLVTRGWTLQEAVLAPRVLHYTSKQLIWECSRRGYVAEGMFSVHLQYTRPTYTEVKTQLQLPPANLGGIGGQGGLEGLRARRLEVLKTWYIQLIELRYATRRLTYAYDKLPAIAGLASWAAPVLACDYIAGMWRTELEWALAWRTHETEPVDTIGPSGAEDSDPSNLGVHDRSQHYRSPSFSWACSNGPVSWDFAVETFQRTAQVEDFHVELDVRSLPFGRVREGCWIQVGGFLSQNKVTPRPGSWNTVTFEDCGEISGKMHMDRVLADAETGGGQESTLTVTCLELGLGSGPQLQTGQWFQEMPRRLCLLVLAPVEGKPGCFTRVGFAHWAWEAGSEACEKYMELREWQTVRVY